MYGVGPCGPITLAWALPYILTTGTSMSTTRQLGVIIKMIKLRGTWLLISQRFPEVPLLLLVLSGDCWQ